MGHVELQEYREFTGVNLTLKMTRNTQRMAASGKEQRIEKFLAQTDARGDAEGKGEPPTK
jgi:hypothetical protein